MKLKALLLIAPLLAFSSILFAKPLTDSVGIENLDGKKVILHKLDPKDNFYSIGRRYNVRPAIIMQFNKDVKMSIGNIIKVPTDIPFVQSGSVAGVQKTKPAPVQQVVVPAPAVIMKSSAEQKPQMNAVNNGDVAQQYKVSAGETLFSISKRFNTSVDALIALNNLKSNNLQPGQILLVKSGTPPPPPAPIVVHTDPAVPTVARRDSTMMVKSDTSAADHRANNGRFGLYEKDERGVATWIDDSSLDPNKKLVLHRTAPIGTVIKITNPMTNRTTFAKVVGRFTESEATKDVILVMTKNTAESIGARDKRIHVIISYGTPND